MITVGIDEVGRGCWAGPVVAGAVILGEPIIGLRDSKQLSRAQRDKLAEQVHATAKAVGIGLVSAPEVDTLGLTAAVALAMRRAVDQITMDFDEIIIDGAYNFLPEDSRSRTIVKADDTIPAVSAASIVAKVARDNYMCEMALKYPKYGFEKHVGYGTAQHANMLRAHGITELHRVSFKPIEFIVSGIR